MNLTPHFTLEEMIATQQRGLDNTPPESVVDELGRTAELLEQVREILGQQIIVTSGYRSDAVNKAVGGVPGSAHVWGGAADFLCPAFGTPLAVCRKLAATPGLAFDQLIHEWGAWTHIGRSRDTLRRQVLTIDGAGTRFGL